MKIGDYKETVQITKERGGKKMKIGDIVKIKECPIPELVGEKAKITDMQMQEFDKYAMYPLWVEITSGEHKGKFYGFKYDEVEVLTEVYQAKDESAKIERETKVVKEMVIERVEEVLKGVTTVDEIAEIEKAIGEAKGKILPEPTLGFWEGKTPCWEMFRCPEVMKNECPAFKYRSLPCWQIEGTYCKLYDYGAKGDGTDICQVCRVYKRWGQGEPIQIKLLGKGFNTIEKAAVK